MTELPKQMAVQGSWSCEDVVEWRLRILVVEDDPLIREFLVEALCAEGHNVIQASNGKDALAWCRHRIADVLVTDIQLPGAIDGWQIAEHCREHDPELPVIFASGFSAVEARPVAGSLSLRKPYHPDEIVRAVRAIGRERPASKLAGRVRDSR
jgi:DNA-binding response OmpR family regulator